MAQVNIIVTSKGVIVNPETVQINRVDQQITWNLAGAQWAPNGIVIDKNPPPPFQPWPSSQPTLVGDKYVVDAADPLPYGVPPEKYRYTININDDNGTMLEISIDPDIGNDPTP